MDERAAGYITEVEYDYGIYDQLSPIRARLALLYAGFAPPEVSTACELGFGHGLSLNVHAAAAPTVWFGCDINPAHANFAKGLALSSGAKLTVSDESFEEFCRRADLPDFDFIGLHGVWSWVSSENRTILVDFFRRKLKPGGVVYVSYNALPGWAAITPVRHLLALYAKHCAPPGSPILDRVEEAIGFVDRLQVVRPGYSRSDRLSGHIDSIRKRNRNYLAHEYFHDNFDPMYFSQVDKLIGAAGLGYTCPANYSWYAQMSATTPQQRGFIDRLSPGVMRETARDFVLDTQFRLDYWTKGARALTLRERATMIEGERLVLTSNNNTSLARAVSIFGKTAAARSMAEGIISLLDTYRPSTIAEIAGAVDAGKVRFEDLLRLLMGLCSMNILSVAQNEDHVIAVKPQTHKLNAALITRSAHVPGIDRLACPVTGGAIKINRTDQLFLLATRDGKEDAEDLCSFAWKVFEEESLREGETVQSAEKRRSNILAKAQTFRNRDLPRLKTLMVI